MLSISSSNDSNSRHQTLPYCNNSNDSSKSITKNLENSHKRPAIQIALDTTSTLTNCQSEQNASMIITKRPRYIEVSSQPLQASENNEVSEVEHKQFVDMIQNDNDIHSYIICNDNVDDNGHRMNHDSISSSDCVESMFVGTNNDIIERTNAIIEATNDNSNEDKSFEKNDALNRHDDHSSDRHSNLWIFQRQGPKQSSVLTNKIVTAETNRMKVTNNISTETYNESFNKHEYESDEVDLLDQQMDCLIRQTENWSLFHARRNKNNSSHESSESSHQKFTKRNDFCDNDNDDNNNNDNIGRKTNISTFEVSNDEDTIILKRNQNKARTARRNVMRAFLKKGELVLQNKS